MTEALTIAELRRWFNNPLIKTFLSNALKNNGKDERLILEEALDNLIFGAKCGLTCRFYSWVIGVILKESAKTFGTDPEEVLKNLKEPVFRRGIINVLDGIAKFGVQTPQTTAAPFLVVWQFTNKCNLRCKHCYASASNRSMPDELTTEEAKKTDR